MRLLVDSGEFMDSLATDLRHARTAVVAQTMTFEGDVAGLRFANLLIHSGCKDKRLLVDSFSRHMISNRFVHGPAARRDRELRRELRATAAAHEALERAAVRIRFTNPAGPLLRRFAARNHKKSIVIDHRVGYLGGLNISDHNFAWHDLMLRIEDAAAVAFLAEDLEATWRRRPRACWRDFAGVAIGTTNGVRNPRSFDRIFDLIASARDDILVQTPYLTFPFTDRLHDARCRGVRVRVIAPFPHPRPGVGEYLEWECARAGLELWRLPGMTHVKAMLIDDRQLVLGSSNFDYLSYRLLQEIFAIVEEPSVIADFLRRVAEVDLSRSSCAPNDLARGGALRRWCMEVAGAALVRVSV